MFMNFLYQWACQVSQQNLDNVLTPTSSCSHFSAETHHAFATKYDLEPKNSVVHGFYKLSSVSSSLLSGQHTYVSTLSHPRNCCLEKLSS